MKPSRTEDEDIGMVEATAKADSRKTKMASLGADDGPSSEMPKFPWKDGRLITRGEPEIKSHTSYLEFAVLPIEWSEEDEAAALAKYPLGKEQRVVGAMDKKAKKQERREMLEQKRGDRKSRRKERDEMLAEDAAI